MKNTVQKAYVGSIRTLVDSHGRAYVDGSWVHTDSEYTLVPGPAYERWVDVPQAWLGHAPWWK